MTTDRHVLHVIPAVSPRYGGPSTAIWPITSHLQELGGWQVEIATTDADGPGSQLTRPQLPDSACSVHLFPRTKHETLKFSPALEVWLTENVHRFDLVQVHSHWNFPVNAACRAARRARVPYILRPCGMLSAYTWQRSKWKKLAYWWLRERRNVLAAAGFHVTSREERDEVRRLGVASPIEIIPLGVDDAAWSVPCDTGWLRDRCPQAGTLPILLFLSRLHPKKGLVQFLLPAMKRMQTAAFLAIVGGEDDHSPGYGKLVQTEIGRLGLENRVCMLGNAAPRERWKAFDGADLFVLPSLSENFGIVVAEALARRLPVVVTEGVQCAEHVTGSRGGKVVSPNVEALAASLDEMLSNPVTRAEHAEAGYRYVRERLTWRQTASGLLAFYESLCRSHASAVS